MAPLAVALQLLHHTALFCAASRVIIGARHPASIGPPPSGMLNLKADFGAKGDAHCHAAPHTSVPMCSGTDDFDAIQAAVTRAYASQLPLLIPSGTYLVNSPIVMALAVEEALAGQPPLQQQLPRPRGSRWPRAAGMRERVSDGEANVYGPLRITGDGMHQSVIVAGPHFPKGSAIMSLPNISNHIEFSHFTVSGVKRADIGIDSPQEIHRSHFDSIGVNGTRIAGIRAAGFINTFESCMVRANEGIGLFLSPGPVDTAEQWTGSLWNNQVNILNNNLEWNRIGVVVANGDEVRIQGNNIEGCGGPGIMVSGVWGLVVRCFEPTSVHFKIFR